MDAGILPNKTFRLFFLHFLKGKTSKKRESEIYLVYIYPNSAFAMFVKGSWGLLPGTREQNDEESRMEKVHLCFFYQECQSVWSNGKFLLSQNIAVEN